MRFLKLSPLNHYAILSKSIAAFTLLTLVFSAPSASAAGSGITYHGRILKPDGSPLEGTNVQFRLQIRTPDNSNCLLFEETKSLNMKSTGGVFELTINDGTGTRTDTTGLALDTLFANRGTLAGTNCSVTGLYSPGVNDGRRFQVQFRDENMSAWEPLAAQTLNFIPLAIESKQVGGFTAASLLRVEDASGPAAVTSFSPAQFSELNLLALGSSTNYLKSTTTGVVVPNRASDPIGASPGQIWYDTASNQLKYYNGSTSQSLASGGSLPALNNGQIWVGNASNAPSAVTFSGDATVSNSGVIALKATGTAGTYVKVTTDAQGRISSGVATLAESDLPASISTPGRVSGSSITSGTISGNTIVNTTGSLTGGAITGTSVWGDSLSSRSLLVYESTNTRKITLTAPAVTADYALKLPAAAPAASQFLVSDASGNLTWNGIASASQWTNNGTDIYFNTGKVGIGTTTPAYNLQISNGGAPALNVSSPSVNFWSLGGATAAGHYSGLAVAGDAVLQSLSPSNTIISNQSGGNLTFATGPTSGSDTAKLTISTGGNVGVGTISPLTPLHVNLGGTPAGSYSVGSGDAFIVSKTAGAGDWARMYLLGGSGSSGSSTLFLGNGNNPQRASLGSSAGLSLEFSVNNAERLRIDSSGNVGIGTATPAVSLDLSARKDAVALPKGNDTSERPVTPAMGMIRYNTVSNALEFYNSTAWQSLSAGGSAGSLSNVSTISNSGGGISLTASAGNSVVVTNGATSLSSTTGALVVTGGAGISENLNVGQNLTANGAISAVAATAATGSNNYSSPSIYLSANYYTGSATAVDNFSITNLTGTGTNPTATLTFDHPSGTSGAKQYSFMNGNFGVGTTAPTTLFTLKSQATGKVQSVWNSATSTEVISLNENGFGYLDVKTAAGVQSARISAGGNSWLNANGVGNVGINTSTPSYVLDVNGTASASALQTVSAGTGDVGNLSLINTNSAGTSSVSFQGSGGIEKGYIRSGFSSSSTDGFLSVGTLTASSVSEKMRISASGNVGIGTSTPSRSLSFSGTTATTIGMEPAPAGVSGNFLTLNAADAGAGTNLAGGALYLKSGSSTGTGGSSILFQTATPSASGTTFNSSNSTKMTIVGNGNVGIGTTTPAYLLDANGAINATSYYLNGSPFTAGVAASAVPAAGGQASIVTQTSTDSATAARSAMLLRNNGIGGTNEYNLRAQNAAGTDTSYIKQDGTAYFAGNTSIGTTNTAYGTLSVLGSAGLVGLNTAADLNFVRIGTAVTAGAVIGNMKFRGEGGSGAVNAASISGVVSTGAIVTTTSVPTDLAISAGTTTPVERMRITSAGNVGIGTSTPGSPLEVAGNIAISNGSSFLAKDSSGTAQTVARMETYNELTFGFSGANAQNWYLNGTRGLRLTGTGLVIGAGSAVSKLDVNGGVTIGSYSGTNAAPTNGMIISGNVGIGTISPTAKLNVVAPASTDMARFTGPAGSAVFDQYGSLQMNSGIMFNNYDSSVAAGSLTTYNSNLYITSDGGGGGTNHHIVLKPSGSGNVGVGTSSPAYKLDVAGDANLSTGSALRIAGTSICTSAGCTAASDVRFKENILPLDASLEKILELQGVGYEWIDKKKFGASKQIGFIAQDLEKVYPEVVVTDSKTGFKSVAYDHLVAPIIESIKVLYEKVTKANARILFLEDENKRLRDQSEAMRNYLCQKDPTAGICN